MKVSVGLAVYNEERYLQQCLDSLICQTLDELEIIIVDDGSTDSSATICERYGTKDSRIKVVHQPHGGLASARQTALEVSTGDYFCVCDADDWVETEMYERLRDKAVETGADVVMCDYWREYGDGRHTQSSYGREITPDNNQLINDVLNDRFPSFIWRKLFRRDIFERYALSWDPDISMQEDYLMTLKILRYPVRMVYLPEPLYHYRRMPGGNSYTNNITLDSYNQMLRIRDWVGKHLSDNQYAAGRIHYQVNVAYAGLRVMEGMTPRYYRETSTSRLGLRELMSERTLKSMLILMTKIFGYRLGFIVNRLLYKRVYR